MINMDKTPPSGPDRSRSEFDPVPGTPHLEAAEVHRAAAEAAAARRDFDTALRERFRAMLRGLEQHGILKVRRSRTAQETADEAAAALPLRQSAELPPAAFGFDEVVYGGRPAGENEYRRLEAADVFSAAAPPPATEPIEVDSEKRKDRVRRSLPLPELLRDHRFWIALVALVLLALLLWAGLHSCAAPSAPPPPPDSPPPPDLPPPRDGDIDPPDLVGSDSIFGRLPAPVAFGGLQFLVTAVLLVWWRARRRGALVGEPRPVEVAADELLTGQAGLYRRSGDHEHIAAVLRAATLRRVRRTLGATAGDTPDALVAAIATRINADPRLIGTALYGPVPDASAVELIAAQLEWIEAEIG